MHSQLVIIRGNSGSGKTTVAKEVRGKLGNGLSDNTMLVQQDILRRDILRERDMPEKRSVIELTELIVDFGREQNRIVILEGIFKTEKYGVMLKKLAKKFDVAHAYYFDIPFEETLIRHATKLNAREFGEKEMREWWNPKDYLGMVGEKIFDENMSIEEVVNQIISDIESSKVIH